ncbi:MAG: glutathione S-transferase family protein [Pseudomonadota bacterium]
MKFFSAKATPFGRTVELVAYELGIHGELEIVPTTVAPTTENPGYQALNPLRKIPALVLDDGTLLTDSGLITRYLASRVGDSQIFADGSPDHWRVMNDYMLAKGTADCLVAARYEGAVRPEAARWPAWLADQLAKAHAVLAYFEKAPPATGGERLTIAAIGLGAALGYMDFRFPDEGWRGRYPALATWAEPVFSRPSFVATRPE